MFGNTQMGGGQNASCDFGGGGGKRTIECPLQNQFWRAPVRGRSLSGKRQGVKKRGGKIVSLGLTKGWFPKGWFWQMFPGNANQNEGTGRPLWYVSPPESFPPPLCFSLICAIVFPDSHPFCRDPAEGAMSTTACVSSTDGSWASAELDLARCQPLDWCPRHQSRVAISKHDRCISLLEGHTFEAEEVTEVVSESLNTEDL